MSLCIGEHVPPETDMIIMEYAVNDPAYERDDPIGPSRRALERLIRSCLAYPNRPPAIVFNYYSFFRWGTDPGRYWDNAEHINHEMELFYHLPSLSLKAAVWQLFHQGADGLGAPHFRVDGWSSCVLKNGRCNATSNSCEQKDCGLGDNRNHDNSFYVDTYHPMGVTGHRAMAELALHFMLGAIKDVLTRPVEAEDFLEALAPLPAPMLPGNYEQSSTSCVFNERFHQLVTQHEGWEYVNEGRDVRRPKWGWVSRTPGAWLTFTMDTRRGMGNTSAAHGGVGEMALGVALLHSYEQMGSAHISCVSGCACRAKQVDLTTAERKSPILNQVVLVTQHPQCVVAVTVAAQPGPSGGYKVKVAGATVSAPDHPEGISGYAMEFLGSKGLAARVDADGYYQAKQPPRR